MLDRMELSRDIGNADELPSLPEFVYSRLRDEILSGQIVEGALLRQESIAARFGVSRLPVREALVRLEMEGLVVSRPRRGYAVALLNLDEIAEIFDIRMMLEESAGRLAAEHRTENDVGDLEILLRDMDGHRIIACPEDAVQFSIRNRAFHNRLFAASGRRYTCKMMLTLRNNVERYIQVGAWMLGTLDQVHADHHQIFDAFRRGDAEAVGYLSREHVRATGERLIAMIRAQRAGRPATEGAALGS